MRTKTAFPILALGFAVAVGTASAAGPGAGRSPAPALAELDSAEAATLLFMREEEKLARDVYLALNQAWPSALFVNIAESEQRHMDSIKKLLDKYGLADPASGVLGVFVDSELQQLYDDLSTGGEGSYLAALKVGGLIEEVDIEDLEDAIAETDNTDVATVYGSLMRGSRNHLRAFAAAIERLGVPYVAQQLPQAEVDAIIDSPMERGGAGGSTGSGGRRNGR